MKENLLRCLWGICEVLLFRCSPRPCWGWRCWLLRLFGARLAREVRIHNSARIQFPWLLTIGEHTSIGEGAILYNLGPLTLGSHVTISQRAHLCGGTHDYRDPDMALLRTPITIGDRAWICAEAFVGPGVEIGEGAILAARGVAVRNIPAGCIFAGNPAQFVKNRDSSTKGTEA